VAERLFHLVEPGAWSAAAPREAWAPASLAREGFVHLSLAHQLAGTLEAHFPAGEALWLLEVDPRPLGAGLRLEPSRDGALFPHLQRALRRAEILGHWRLGRDAAGRWRLPRLGPAASADAPQRSAGAP
jgi:uncharacterized protein (DUF952 family)